MKGIILAGGLGTRLMPCTMVTNKHLLPVYDKPMVYYPLATLVEAGVTELLLVSGPEHSGHFAEILGDGSKFGCRIRYMVQMEPGGIAQALSLAQGFVEPEEEMIVILGDNIFSDKFEKVVKNFKGGAQIFLKAMEDAQRFGIAELDEKKNVVAIEEKPKEPKTNLAVTGLYVYDYSVFEKIKTLKPSKRGELEITDVNNAYVREGRMQAEVVKGEWTDAGTFASLYRASHLVKAGIVRSPF